MLASEDAPMSKLHGIRPFLICGLMIVFASEALAQAQRATPSQDPPPVDRSGSIQARKKIADAKVVEARKKLAEATTAVALLKKQFDSSVGTDAGWQENKKAVDMAQEQVATAQKELKDALAREKEADKQRQDQIRQNRRGY